MELYQFISHDLLKQQYQTQLAEAAGSKHVMLRRFAFDGDVMVT